MGQSETSHGLNITLHALETDATIESTTKGTFDRSNLSESSVSQAELGECWLKINHVCFCRTIQQIISSIRCNDLMTPVKRLASERFKLKNRGVERTHSIYRDILFLAFVAIGRENIDVQMFHREYAMVFEKLTMIERKENLYHSQDLPPTSSALFCRAFFRPLLLLP